jgi:hypothetical protein
LSRGQRRDKKLVVELPPVLETVTFPTEDWVDGSLVLGSASADFAWNLFLWETQIPFLNNLLENGEKFRVETGAEVLGNGKLLTFVGKSWSAEVEKWDWEDKVRLNNGILLGLGWLLALPTLPKLFNKVAY